MDTSEHQAEGKSTPHKKGHFKRNLHIVLILVILGALAYGYIWYRATNSARIEAENVIDRAERFDALQAALDAERDRCEKFIAQQEGNFGSFEYCRTFIDWAEPYQ
jgi:predicted negative regulator of RcsB-dependent stress response